jgi:cytidylate kinase
MSVITISRQSGSLGNEVAEMLSGKLGWELIDREKILSRFMTEIASPFELRMLSESTRFYLSQSGKGVTFLQYMKDSITAYAEKESVILMGFGSQAIFAGNDLALHIRIIAPEDVRMQRIRKQYHISDQEAREILLISDRKHKRFVSTLFQIDVTDPSHYDLTFNTAQLSVYECVAAIQALLREREQRQSFDRESETAHAVSNTEDCPVLKNPAET